MQFEAKNKWIYYPSTQQSFILVNSLFPIEEGDILGAFKHDICVGWVEVLSKVRPAEYITLPIMGKCILENTGNYLEEGEIPDLKIWKMNTEEIQEIKNEYNWKFSNNSTEILEFQNLRSYILDRKIEKKIKLKFLPGDFNNDGIVDIKDLIEVIHNWKNPYTIIELIQVIKNWKIRR